MDFENLTVYRKAKEFNRRINEDIFSISSLDRIIKDQLRRASLSIVLNIAEGCSRFLRRIGKTTSSFHAVLLSSRLLF